MNLKLRLIDKPSSRNKNSLYYYINLALIKMENLFAYKIIPPKIMCITKKWNLGSYRILCLVKSILSNKEYDDRAILMYNVKPYKEVKINSFVAIKAIGFIEPNQGLDISNETAGVRLKISSLKSGQLVQKDDLLINLMPPSRLPISKLHKAKCPPPRPIWSGCAASMQKVPYPRATWTMQMPAIWS